MTPLVLHGRVCEALLGCTGFVGRNLAEAHAFPRQYHSRNGAELRGQRVEALLCAALYAEKWRANKEPEADLAHVKGVYALLREVRTELLVLVSTIDVHDPPAGDEATALDPARLHPYGRHRLLFEQWLRAQFPRVMVLRLPGLYGPHLKKNAVFDMLRNNQPEKVNPHARLQWADVRDTPRALAVMAEHDISLLNYVPAPLATATIRDRCFPGMAIGAAAGAPVAYDVRTRHAAAFGRTDGYVQGAEESLAGIARFVAA